MSSTVIRRAEPGDTLGIQQLLRNAGQGTDGVEFENFIVLEEGDGSALLGCAGMNSIGSHGVMRLAAPTEGNNRYELQRLFLAFAKTKGIDALYVTASSDEEKFLLHLGFTREHKLPNGIRNLNIGQKILAKHYREQEVAAEGGIGDVA